MMRLSFSLPDVLRSRLPTIAGVLCLVCLLFSIPSRVHAQTSGASGATALTTGSSPQTITTPLQINSPGTYYLTQDVVASSAGCNGINIAASNVTLDLNGHTISTPVAGSVSSNGVYNSGVYASNCINVTIRNGHINGFLYGICISSSLNSQQAYDDSLSADHLIENLVIDHSTLAGIYLQGGESLVRRCQITNTGGTDIQTSPDSNGLVMTQPYGYGMLFFGPGHRVIDCDINGVNGNANDIYSSAASFGYGIYFWLNATGCFAAKNRISGVDKAIYFDAGATGKYSKNIVTVRAGASYYGGSDADGNIVDSNGNGIDDAWEMSYFGNLTHTNPNEDYDGDGLTNLQEYLQGSDPTHYTSPLPLAGLVLQLAADNIPSPGSISQWNDRSGLGHNATQPVTSQQPTMVTNQLNGEPVVRFTAIANQFFNLPNFLSTAAAGEIIYVLKSSAAANGYNALAQFGSNADWYSLRDDSDGDLMGGFGSSADHNQGQAPAITRSQFNIYDESSQSNLWQSWLNGAPFYQSATNTVSFSTNASSTPLLGGIGNFWFNGDIAEIIAYNRSLSPDERKAINTYLGKKYALAASPMTPTGLSASKLSSIENLVTWNNSSSNFPVDYIVGRATTSSGPFATIAVVSGSHTYLDNSATSGQVYYYRVYAQNVFGQSAPTAAMAALDVHSNGRVVPVDGLRLWLMGDGTWESPLVDWHDYSGYSNDAFAPPGAGRPTVVISSANGKPVVHFDATGKQYMTLPNFLNEAAAGEIVYVLKDNETANGYNALLSFGPNQDWYGQVDGSLGGGFGSTSQYNEGQAPAFLRTQFNIYDESSQSNLWQSWLNGTPLFTSTVNTVSFTLPYSELPRLGEVNGGNSIYLNADLAEILVYNRVLTDAERSAVNTYLASKYLLPNMDPDHDGLTTAQELAIGTDPLSADTNHDGMLDGIEYFSGFNPTSMDVDGDSISNAQELINGTNPFSADTDHDGVRDNQDSYPLDPTRSQAPAQTSGAPVLTLTYPPNTILH